MIDPRIFRDADAFAAASGRLLRRGDAPALRALLEALRGLAERRRQAIAEGEALTAQQNAKSRLVAEKKKKGEDAAALLTELSALKLRVETAESASKAADHAFHERLLELP